VLYRSVSTLASLICGHRTFRNRNHVFFAPSSSRRSVLRYLATSSSFRADCSLLLSRSSEISPFVAKRRDLLSLSNFALFPFFLSSSPHVFFHLLLLFSLRNQREKESVKVESPLHPISRPSHPKKNLNFFSSLSPRIFPLFLLSFLSHSPNLSHFTMAANLDQPSATQSKRARGHSAMVSYFLPSLSLDSSFGKSIDNSRGIKTTREGGRERSVGWFSA